MAHDKHEQVRQRYGHRCGYCGVSEADAGGDLTVDHYHPVSADGDDSDGNLVYACFRCNLNKGDFFPTADDLVRGHRVLHPLQDVLTAHLRLDERTGLLESLTETGRFHVGLLRLNRRALVRHRLQMRLVALLIDSNELLKAELAQLRTDLDVCKNEIAILTSLLDPPPREAGPGSSGQ